MRILIVIIALILCASCLLAQNSPGLRKLNGADLFLSIKGKGPTLVIIHGGPGLNHSYFTPHLSELEKKFRVVYYDQRASGQSSTPSEDSLSMNFFVEDLEALRNYLKVEKLNVIAHSWGSVLFTNYALKYPQRIYKAMLVSPAMLSREYDQEAAANAKRKNTQQDSIERAMLVRKPSLQIEDYDKLLKLSFKASAFDPENIENVNLNLPANFTTASRKLFGGLMKDPSANANLYDSLSHFNFPVLIIHGKADILPLSSIERMRKILPLGSSIMFEQSGHFPFIEEKKKFITLAIDYFQK